MHQKQPPAKIAVSDAAARPRLGAGADGKCGKQERRSAPRRIHRAIMEVSRLKSGAEHKNGPGSAA